MKKKIISIILTLFAILVMFIAYCLIGSLPLKNGEKKVSTISNQVQIGRDKYSIANLKGKSRADIAYGMGFVHAQERFFQMDLLRRKGAGELSELFGEFTLEFDKYLRMHRFRNQAKIVMNSLSPEEKKLLNFYADGVNQGLSLLRCWPIEYLLLREKPVEWKPEDSLLVGYALFFALQDSGGDYDRTRGAIKEILTENQASFFLNNSSQWASLLCENSKTEVNLNTDDFYTVNKKKIINLSEENEVNRGSNQWAISSKLSENNSSIIACDMHLDLAVPNTWFRVTLDYLSSKDKPVYVSGVTLPGTPLIIIGSSRNLAWGFTSSYIDTTDLIVLDTNPKDKSLYLTEEGYTEFSEYFETIKIKGKESVSQKYLWTKWGPVAPELFKGKLTSIKWIAHEEDAFNLKLSLLEEAESVEEAVDLAAEINIPVLNFIAIDSSQNMVWTYLGKVPDRMGYLPGLPVSFFDKNKKWRGVKSYAKEFAISNPTQGFLYTANNQVINKSFLGHNFLNGIRAFQIKETLKSTNNHNIETMKKIQNDETALFLKRWQGVLQNLLDSSLDEEKKMLTLINTWDGAASSSSQEYYWIRKFRKIFSQKTLNTLFTQSAPVTTNLKWHLLDLEEPIYLLALQALREINTEKGNFVLSQLLNESKEELISEFEASPEKNWGKSNTFLIQHPLSKSLGFFGKFFDMPNTPSGGDSFCPKVCRPKVGASVRLIAVPAERDKCLINMPCGQSGHFLSRHYRDHHKAWLKGEYFQLDCGELISILTLKPEKN